MRDPDDDDDTPPHRDDRLFGTSGFRRKLSDSLTGLLDPDGALGKGKDFVTGVSQATKTEVVRMVSAEVRNFLDGMDTVDLLQRVISGLVIDVKTEIRFSIDPQGQLKPTMTTKESEIRSVHDPKKEAAPPRAPEPPRTAAPESRRDAAAPRVHETSRPSDSRTDMRSEARSDGRSDGRSDSKPGGKPE